MKIAVLGTGIVGRTIAAKLADLGHTVTMGTRNVEEKLQSEKKEAYGSSSFKSWYGQQSGIDLRTYSDAVADAELVFNCTSGQGTISALEAAGSEHLDGKIIVDIANPLDFSNGMPPSLNPVNTDSLAEVIQRTFPDARVVKTLNTMNANLMVAPAKLKGDHNVFMSGNDAAAKAEVSSLLQSFGWKAEQILDLGDISTARGTEMLLPIWLRLWQALGTAEFNFHIQRHSAG